MRSPRQQLVLILEQRMLRLTGKWLQHNVGTQVCYYVVVLQWLLMPFIYICLSTLAYIIQAGQVCYIWIYTCTCTHIHFYTETIFIYINIFIFIFISNNYNNINILLGTI